MKQLIQITLLTTLSYGTYGQNETDIYKQVISDFVLKDQQKKDQLQPAILVVLERPAYMRELTDKDYVRFKGKYKKLGQRTFEDFIKSNQIALQVQNIRMLSGIEIVILERGSILNRETISEKYPNWNRLVLEFSNIGLDDSKQQALVYYGFDGGAGVGGGVYIVYEKKGRKWNQKKIIPAWGA